MALIKDKDVDLDATEAVDDLINLTDWPKNCFEEEIFEILDVFGEFVGNCADKDALKNIVCAVSNLMYENDDVRECYRTKIPETLNMFCECAKYESSQEDVACALDGFIF